jgi:hypothetical protein
MTNLSHVNKIAVLTKVGVTCLILRQVNYIRVLHLLHVTV